MEAPPRELSSLPNPKHLSSTQITFLNHHITSQHHLSLLPDLASNLNDNCVVMDDSLTSLRSRLTRLAVSWIYRSFSAKSSIRNLGIKLNNLSLSTSQRGGDLNEEIFGDNIRQLAKEVKRIENIRTYIDTALRLEVLVGDLEDAVFFVNRHTMSILSAGFSNHSVKQESQSKQEKLLQAIKAMNDIENIAMDISKCQQQWCHLLKSVDSRVDQTMAVLRPKVIADHRALLASLGWPPALLTSNTGDREVSGVPNPLVLMQEGKRKSYCNSFLALCALQRLHTRREDRKLNCFKQKDDDIRLWAIDELVSPIRARIEYHFTKWADRPEFMFALLHKVTRDFIVGVDDVLQPLIDEARLGSISAREAWVFSMVRIMYVFLEKKVFSDLVESYKEKSKKEEVMFSWLHLIDLIIGFDKRIQSLVKSESCLYMETEMLGGSEKGISILNIFSDKPDWLKIWAKIEIKNAWKKFKVELSNVRWQVLDKKHNNNIHKDSESENYLLTTREDHKAPVISEFVLKTALLMIERCQTLPTLPRLQFIRSTAGKFLWCFINVLNSHCRIEDLQFGSLDENDALIRICGSINAAKYIEYKLQEWSDDVNFLDINTAEDSCEVNQKPVEVDFRSFFEEEIKVLAELETNWLMEIIAALLRHFEMLSWTYVQNKEQFALGRNLHPTPAVSLSVNDLTISDDLLEALEALRNQLQILKMNLNAKDFLDLWRNLADGLDHFIFRSILTSDTSFSEKGISQFGTDMTALYFVFQPLCARPEAFFPCIRDSIKLLNMNKEEAKHLEVLLSYKGSGMNQLQCCGISELSSDEVYKVMRNKKLQSHT